jgi:hypothetical protein
MFVFHSTLDVERWKLDVHLLKQPQTFRVLIETFFLKIIFAFGILNFGHCDLFGIWYLCFGISGLSGLGSGKENTHQSSEEDLTST